jgi:uncharacterized membrane protein (DUF2068 family)
MKRSMQTTIAAILNVLFSLVNIALGVSLLSLGADAVNQQAATESPPYLIVVIAVILGVVGLVGSWGLWQNQKWAKIVVIVISALGGLSAMPGILFAETLLLRMSAIAGVVIPLVIIILLLWRSSKAAAESAAD